MGVKDIVGLIKDNLPKAGVVNGPGVQEIP